MQNETRPIEDTQSDTHTLEADVRHTVAQGTDVEEAVRKLTYEALSAHPLDTEALRKIMDAVVRGAREGIEQSAAQAQAAHARLSQAMSGLDTALAQFAEATKLTVEEAVSRAESFSHEDLAKVRADLEGLEALFLETLKNSAGVAKDTVSDVLRDIIAHAQRSGTAIGTQLQETLSTLTQQIGQVGHTQIVAGLHLAHATAQLMRDLAAGVLGGLADRLKPRHEPKGKAD